MAWDVERGSIGDQREASGSADKILADLSYQGLRASAPPRPPAHHFAEKTSVDNYRSVNAAAEAFNSLLKVEYVHRHRFTTRTEARIKIATWIADFYNTTRRHSANDGLAPSPFEHQIATARAASAVQVRDNVA